METGSTLSGELLAQHQPHRSLAGILGGKNVGTPRPGAAAGKCHPSYASPQSGPADAGTWGTVPEVQRVLGHSRISTTGIYLTPSEEDVRLAIGRAGV